MAAFALGIVRHQGQVLLVRRIAGEGRGFALPQGPLEVGETPPEAVVRVLYAETGLTVSPKELLAELKEAGDVTYCYACELVAWGDEDDEDDELLWVSRQALGEQLSFGLGPALAAYLGLPLDARRGLPTRRRSS